MRLSFAQVRRCGDLVDVVEAIAVRRGEIAEMEQQLAIASASPEGEAGLDAVGHIRDRVARDELAAKRTEVEELIARAEALARDIGSGHPAASTLSGRPGQSWRDRGVAAGTGARPIRFGPVRVLKAGVIGFALAASFAAGQVVGNPGHGVSHEPLGAPVVAAAERPRADPVAATRSRHEPAFLSNGSGITFVREVGTQAAAGSQEPDTTQVRAEGLVMAPGVEPATAPEIAEAESEIGQEPSRASPDLADPAPALPSGRLIAGTAGSVNLRQAPSLRAPVVEVIPSGARVGLLDGRVRADGLAWQQVRSPNAEDGWVAAGTVAR